MSDNSNDKIIKATISPILCPIVCTSCGKVNQYEKPADNAKVTYRCQYCGAKN